MGDSGCEDTECEVMRRCVQHRVLYAVHCPACVLDQLKTKGGSPLTAGVSDYIKSHSTLPLGQALVDYWQQELDKSLFQ